MPDFTLTVPELISIYVDGVFLANATNYELNTSKTTNKVPVIGTTEQRISEGSVEINGSLTLLKTSDLTARLLRVREVNNLDFQPLSKVYPGGVTEFDQGVGMVTQTLNSGDLLFAQNFVALGTKLRQIYFTAKRNAAFINDVQIRLMSGATPLQTYVVKNDTIPTVKGQVEVLTTTADVFTTLTPGTTYTLEYSIPVASAGQVEFYGGDLQALFEIGTANGVQTEFDLNHTNVLVDTLYVRLGNDGWLGQLESYTFGNGTGTSGVDEIVFAVAPVNGTKVYATYQHATNNLVAWKLGFSTAGTPSYTIKYESRNTQGVLLDAYVIERVKFTSNGLAVNPAAFIEQTVQFEGEIINTSPY
jgi:hypothetical protein